MPQLVDKKKTQNFFSQKDFAKDEVMQAQGPCFL